MGSARIFYRFFPRMQTPPGSTWAPQGFSTVFFPGCRPLPALHGLRKDFLPFFFPDADPSRLCMGSARRGREGRFDVGGGGGGLRVHCARVAVAAPCDRGVRACRSTVVRCRAGTAPRLTLHDCTLGNSCTRCTRGGAHTHTIASPPAACPRPIVRCAALLHDARARPPRRRHAARESADGNSEVPRRAVDPSPARSSLKTAVAACKCHASVASVVYFAPARIGLDVNVSMRRHGKAAATAEARRGAPCSGQAGQRRPCTGGARVDCGRAMEGAPARSSARHPLARLRVPCACLVLAPAATVLARR